MSMTDALGYTYDALDRAATATDAAGGITHYAYDTDDDLVQVTDPRGLTTTYGYDGFGDLLKQVSPDTGTTTLSYDAYGRLAGKARADGTQFSYTYDALNRITSATAGGVTRSYTWDVCTHGIGRLCTASNGTSNIGYSYSPEGWITGRAFTFANGSGYSLGYAYDGMGQLAAVVYPDGNQALYDYTDGAVADVRVNAGGHSGYAASGVTYLPMDLAMTGWTSANGLANSLGYDADLRPTSISVPNVESLAFNYSAANEIIGITNGINNANSQGLSYDADGRLTGVSGAETASYHYDADGNRIGQVVNGTTTNFSYATASNQLVASSGGLAASYGYDANGNTVSVNGGTAYSYGPFGALTNASGAAFTISAEGQRLSKSFAGNTTYFAPGAGGALLAEDNAGQWHDYVWLNGRLIGVIASGAVYPAHSDQTGRPIAMTNATDTSIVWQAMGLPFDRTVTASMWGDFNIGFPGQYFDTEDNLWHNGYRDYDAATGRYIESDPIGLTGGVNTYAYVESNPVNSFDPSGEEGVGQWTYPVGSSDARDYQNALSGCYDKQAKEVLAATLIVGGVVVGGEGVVALGTDAPKIIFLIGSFFGQNGPEIDVVENLQTVEEIQEAAEVTQTPPPPTAPPPPGR